jgi:hypothetical protein
MKEEQRSRMFENSVGEKYRISDRHKKEWENIHLPPKIANVRHA